MFGSLSRILSPILEGVNVLMSPLSLGITNFSILMLMLFVSSQICFGFGFDLALTYIGKNSFVRLTNYSGFLTC